ncbi:MAG: hypothetical protein ACTSP4_00750 [Candidatus Hodarchaeales archaeon]
MNIYKKNEFKETPTNDFIEPKEEMLDFEAGLNNLLDEMGLKEPAEYKQLACQELER